MDAQAAVFEEFALGDLVGLPVPLGSVLTWDPVRLKREVLGSANYGEDGGTAIPHHCAD